VTSIVGGSDRRYLAGLHPRQLECFIAVAEEGNLGRAAGRLHLAQPPLTRRIRQLEQDIGTQLFRRTAAGMELTEPGAVLLERAQRIVTLSERAVSAAQRSVSGTVGNLVVGYYDSAILFGIPMLFREFRRQCPDVSIRFERVPKQAQMGHVLDRVLHVAFGRHYPDQPGVVHRTIATEALFLAVNVSQVDTWPESVQVADLRGRPLVLYPQSRPEFADEVIHLCLGEGFAPTVAIESHDVVSSLAQVSIGSVASVVPESATKVQTDDVTFFPLTDAPSIDLSCIYLAERRSSTMEQLITFLEERALRARQTNQRVLSASARA
jgi:DNA-binding transcriptional LysR family regulator